MKSSKRENINNTHSSVESATNVAHSNIAVLSTATPIAKKRNRDEVSPVIDLTNKMGKMIELSSDTPPWAMTM
jgi:hypothetical protein